MNRPRIGINCDVEAGRRELGDTKLFTLNPDYARAIARAGATPVLLPAVVTASGVDLAALDDQLDVVDGVLLVGGADMDPRVYGEESHPSIVPLDPERDAYDLALARAALERGIPILGVCGGMQLLAVARGGSLHQHLPDRRTDCYPELVEVHREPHRDSLSHSVAVHPKTTLASILGVSRLVTNSRHHQAVNQLGSGQRVAATTDDGVVEAIEAADGRFVIGVQWHPEERATDAASIRLFSAFVAAAGDRTVGRARRSTIDRATPMP